MELSPYSKSQPSRVAVINDQREELKFDQNVRYDVVRQVLLTNAIKKLESKLTKATQTLIGMRDVTLEHAHNIRTEMENHEQDFNEGSYKNVMERQKDLCNKLENLLGELKSWERITPSPQPSIDNPSIASFITISEQSSGSLHIGSQTPGDDRQTAIPIQYGKINKGYHPSVVFHGFISKARRVTGKADLYFDTWYCPDTYEFKPDVGVFRVVRESQYTVHLRANAKCIWAQNHSRPSTCCFMACFKKYSKTLKVEDSCYWNTASNTSSQQMHKSVVEETMLLEKDESISLKAVTVNGSWKAGERRIDLVVVRHTDSQSFHSSLPSN